MIVNGVQGAPLSSFKVENSETAVPIMSEATDGPEEKTFTMDWVQFDGHLYRDQMCLNMINPKNRVLGPGGLCVHDQVFMAINKLNSTTHYEGFVGLGPERPGEDQSYVATLYNQR